MKVLSIGQLPKEVGGTYTTGIAKVVYELSKQHLDDVEQYLYATNITEAKARQLCRYDGQYMGYKYLIGRIIKNVLCHPIETLKQWMVYRKENNENPLRFELYKANFQRAIENVTPDIIHLHGVGLAPLYYARKNRRIPIVLTCHGVFQRNVNVNSQQRRFADYVTGLTDETKEEIIKYFCVDENKITLIPNGVNVKMFYYSEEERNNIRTEFGVKNDRRVFITVASVQERKGQLRFLKILKDWLENNWEYWIVGKGPDEDAIKNYCEVHGLSGKVRLLGYKTGAELYKYYSAADIYAHASTMEGQALCEIEAFSTGLKILVNEQIKGTISRKELEVGDYLVMDFKTPDYKKLDYWLSIKNGQRKTIRAMDWAIVATQYRQLYNRILSK